MEGGSCELFLHSHQRLCSLRYTIYGLDCANSRDKKLEVLAPMDRHLLPCTNQSQGSPQVLFLFGMCMWMMLCRGVEGVLIGRRTPVRGPRRSCLMDIQLKGCRSVPSSPFFRVLLSLKDRPIPPTDSEPVWAVTNADDFSHLSHLSHQSHLHDKATRRHSSHIE